MRVCGGNADAVCQTLELSSSVESNRLRICISHFAFGVSESTCRTRFKSRCSLRTSGWSLSSSILTSSFLSSCRTDSVQIHCNVRDDLPPPPHPLHRHPYLEGGSAHSIQRPLGSGASCLCYSMLRCAHSDDSS